MTFERQAKLRPMRTAGQGKRGVRTQFGALCWRVRDGKAEVLLTTSRRRKRWIIPKGWPMNGQTAADAAAQEAWEEAGVRGEAGTFPVGIYSYVKEMDGEKDLPVLVTVFPLLVSEQKKKFPESKLRQVRWMRPKKAAKLVDEPELKHLLRHFKPKRLLAA